MSQTKPNLIYVFADQLRFDRVGFNGDKQAHTPHLDAFAQQSVNFTNAVSNYPICAPYRASLFTGKYVTSHGMVINELRLNPNQRCFGHVLTEGGYKTSYIGKWHLYANEFGHHPETRNAFVPPGEHRLGFDGEWKAYGFNHEHYDGYYFEDTPEKKFYPEGVYETDGQTDFAIEALKRHADSDDDKPLALFLSWGPPHSPWTPDNVPARFLDLFRDQSFPNPPNYKGENDEPYADDWQRVSPEERAQWEEWRRVYAAQTACVDENFGRLMQALDELGLSENSIVIFTSDHGEMMGAHGRLGKSIWYEEACRVPFLMRWPEHIAPHTNSDTCLSTVDIMPTLLSLLDLPIPDSVEGFDLSHCALGQNGAEPEFAFLQGTGAVAIWEDGHEWRALRDKQFTYAIARVDGREWLFDHQADPYQMRDLSDDEQFRDVLEKLRGAMRAKMTELSDTFPASSWYEANWTDGNRVILRAARGEFA